MRSVVYLCTPSLYFPGRNLLGAWADRNLITIIKPLIKLQTEPWAGCPPGSWAVAPCSPLQRRLWRTFNQRSCQSLLLLKLDGELCVLLSQCPSERCLIGCQGCGLSTRRDRESSGYFNRASSLPHLRSHPSRNLQFNPIGRWAAIEVVLFQLAAC